MTMARQLEGTLADFAIYIRDYDSGEIDTLAFADVTTSAHSIVRRADGKIVARMVATWGDCDLVRLQASGAVTGGMIDLAKWRFTDAADAADAAYEIVPSIG
jgi:hypothetical protein